MATPTLPTPRPARPARGGLGRFAAPRTITALMLREMQTTYGRSPGGFVWAFIEPALGIALLTFALSLAFAAPPIGTNFPLFYATGMVPFLIYADLAAKIAQSLQFSRPLLAYPSVTWLDAIIARFLLNGLTKTLVFYVIFAGVLILFDTRTIVDLPRAASALAMAMTLALSVGVLNCYLFTRFDVWQRVWAILNRPLFLISCVIFVFDAVPRPYRDILWYNPLVHIIGESRRAFYPAYTGDYVSPLYVYGLSLTLLLLGLALLHRNHRLLLGG